MLKKMDPEEAGGIILPMWMAHFKKMVSEGGEILVKKHLQARRVLGRF